MQHIQGIARDQISFSSFEDRISKDNPLRFIDVFAAKLDLDKIGFSVNALQKEGRIILIRVLLSDCIHILPPNFMEMRHYGFFA